MTGLLEVAHALAQKLPPHVVYVGLALSVCAGSSLLSFQTQHCRRKNQDVDTR